MLCCVVTACDASVTHCCVVGDDTFCFCIFPPYSWNPWHTVAIVRHTYNSGSFQNMLCWIVTVWYNSATYCYIVRNSTFYCKNFPPYDSNAWHTVATVRHTNIFCSSHNILCWISTVWYNSATYCAIVRVRMFCRWIVLPHCLNAWHNVANLRHIHNSCSLHNMLCRIVTVCCNSATYCYIVRDSMFCRWIVSPYCSNASYSVATVRHSNSYGSVYIMLCWIVTVYYSSATYCCIVRDSMFCC
jgi:hypothetical protein